MRRRGKGCLSYLVGAGNEAFVVDPSADIGVYVRLADEHGWMISRVFDTHLHADHLSGARALSEATGASLHLNPADTFEFSYLPLDDGDRFELPDGVSLRSAPCTRRGTPVGPRSTSWPIRCSCPVTPSSSRASGVPTSPTGPRSSLTTCTALFTTRCWSSPTRRSCFPAHYGDEVVVRPDQPVGATLDELRQALAPLSYDEDAFVSWATAHSVARPPNYVEIVEANMGRTSRPLASLRQLEIGPNRCAVSA